MIDKTIQLAMDLIARPSITPHDHGCQELIIARLQPLGFRIERLKFGDVENLWAVRGDGAPLLVFAGHTDVVPPGPREQWTSDPFSPTLRDGYLYGRGAADMKSSVAAFVTAVEEFVAAHPKHPGAVALLITADEEGASIDGTAKVVEWLNARGVKIDYCIVGEPTSVRTLGDVIKIGRRGSLGGRLTVRGVQGHVAYPQLAKNPIHQIAPVLAEIATTEWDRGTVDFPPTTFQVSNIHSGTGADNVIPGTLEVRFNFRFSPAVTAAELKQQVETLLSQHNLDYEIAWALSAPYLTHATALRNAVTRSIKQIAGIDAQALTDGGTSDGRFIAPTGAEVVELGPVNASIHKINERVSVEDVIQLVQIYRAVIDVLFVKTNT